MLSSCLLPLPPPPATCDRHPIQSLSSPVHGCNDAEQQACSKHDGCQQWTLASHSCSTQCRCVEPHQLPTQRCRFHTPPACGATAASCSMPIAVTCCGHSRFSPYSGLLPVISLPLQSFLLTKHHTRPGVSHALSSQQAALGGLVWVVGSSLEKPKPTSKPIKTTSAACLIMGALCPIVMLWGANNPPCPQTYKPPRPF
jgi:hypothetical protein